MSESDSDLDYASADEDTNCDVNVKNNNVSTKTAHSAVKGDSAFPIGTSEMKSCVLETFKQESSRDASNELPEDLDNLQIREIHDTDNNSNENKSPMENISAESEQSKNVSFVKSSKINTPAEDDLIGKSIITEAPPIKVQEKQRVTLRLEKKIQQKKQLSKDHSVENNSTAVSSESAVKKQELKSSSWGFGGWGTNLLSTAASSVSSFTNQVSQGIGTVLETVETTLGAPSPEELAAALKEKKESDNSSTDKIVATENSDTEAKGENISQVKPSMLPNMSSWTKVLENTGSKVIMGGLDTLELIGKKTIDMITEGDPGLRKKRAVFSDGITLSQILREAKDEADESKHDDSDGIETVHYSQLFDEYQGLVHLEALEMLSKQSEVKVQRHLMRLARNADVRKNMEEIKSICENIPQLDDPTDCGDFEDFVTVCKKCVLELNLTLNVENIIKAQKRITEVLRNYESATATFTTPEEVYQSAICCLAEFTAKSIEAFHKLGELILVQPTLEPNVEHFATNLTGLTTVMCIEVNNLSSRYHRCLDSVSEQYENGSSEKSNITAIVTNLYLEAANSNKYIQDAFLLLVPVLQVSLLESLQ